MIDNIPINKLHPHPDNPRKDLGDLTELAESIKKSGVLQNLTVVPWFSAITRVGCDNPKNQEEMGYRVVIGHRRLAAAKLAGLTELPCVISDMPIREQVATMLLENMQRNDLTPYEQAQGFQMMMNLGDTVKEIAERTGFSATTVRHRVKLLDLDQNKLKEATDRGATLLELIELEKIKDIDSKNAVLAKAGTSNFTYELKRVIDAEERAERIAAQIAKLEAFATKLEEFNWADYQYIKFISPIEEVHVPDDAETAGYFFCVETYGIQLFKRKEIKEIRGHQVDPEEEKKRSELLQRVNGLREASEIAYKCRLEFVQNVPAAKIKKNIADIIAAMSLCFIDAYISIDVEDLCETLGINLSTEDEENDGDIIASIKETVANAVAKAPEKALLLLTYLAFDDGPGNNYSPWEAKHKDNEELDYLYDLLTKLGYQMSADECSLQDGTHKLFKDGEVNE